MTLADIIARLEKATGPDRDLDVEIMILRLSQIAGHDVKLPRPHELAPYFTDSLDAALTLVPDFCSYELVHSAAGEPTYTRARLWDWRRGPFMIDPANEWEGSGCRPLPVNLCIAALRAREAMGEKK